MIAAPLVGAAFFCVALGFRRSSFFYYFGKCPGTPFAIMYHVGAQAPGFVRLTGPHRMKHSRRSSKSKPRRRDGKRQVLVVLTIGAAIALGLFATDQVVTERQRDNAVKAAAAAQSDEEIYTGSILYSPDDGRLCHQVLFDNQTGAFTDNGNVDCARAAYHSLNEPPKEWSVARVRVISTGFRGQ
jgi:hypothetical protein